MNSRRVELPTQAPSFLDKSIAASEPAKPSSTAAEKNVRRDGRYKHGSINKRRAVHEVVPEMARLTISEVPVNVMKRVHRGRPYKGISAKTPARRKGPAKGISVQNPTLPKAPTFSVFKDIPSQTDSPKEKEAEEEEYPPMEKAELHDVFGGSEPKPWHDSECVPKQSDDAQSNKSEESDMEHEEYPPIDTVLRRSDNWDGMMDIMELRTQFDMLNQLTSLTN